MGRKSMVLAAAGAVLSLASAPRIVNPCVAASEAQVVDPEGVQTFSGTVVKSGEKYLLDDSANKTSYELDDAEKASGFETKKVKVTGILDAAKKLIHVKTIEATA
jgi:hypothetical protein